jgi:hypothetical protein
MKFVSFIPAINPHDVRSHYHLMVTAGGIEVKKFLRYIFIYLYDFDKLIELDVVEKKI